jgi:hypothetical protein
MAQQKELAVAIVVLEVIVVAAVEVVVKVLEL